MMEKEKNEGRKNKGRLENIPPGARLPESEQDDAVEEIFGVHVLGDEDLENHFGASPEDESTDGSEQKTKSE